jgi:hypothetical protein
MATEEYRLSTDIESAGDKLSDAIIEIGVCLFSTTRGTLEKRRWSISLEKGQVVDPTKKFWIDNAVTLAAILGEAKPALVQIPSFIEWFDRVTSTYQPLQLLSDNPTFDQGTRLDLLLCKYQPLRAYPYRYVQSTGQYLYVQDAGEMLWSLGLISDCKAVVNRIAPHSHRADDDAEHICWMTVLASSVAGWIKGGYTITDVKRCLSDLVQCTSRERLMKSLLK